MEATASAISPEPAAPPRGIQERVSDVITSFCGDMKFVYVHAAAFAVWIATKGFGNDAFPFNFLTMAVSLEAIFLSTFILISQNRQQAIADANNKLVQQRQMQMLNDVMTDEKLDLKNEQMISKLLHRIDVEHIRPIAKRLDEVHAAVARLDAGRDT
jgi:uncharacterized membrane protein